MGMQATKMGIDTQPITEIYPLVSTEKAMENGHRNSHFFARKMVIFQFANCKRLPERSHPQKL